MVEKLEAWVGRGVMTVGAVVIVSMLVEGVSVRDRVGELEGAMVDGDTVIQLLSRIGKIETQMEATTKGDRFTAKDGDRLEDEVKLLIRRLEFLHLKE